MKIIGFVASPRKEGNTSWVVSQILAGAQKEAAQTRIWHASALDIKPCRGCLACVQSGECLINDDMHKLYDALGQADALVFGSPIYMGQMSAQAKLFIDRLFAQITPRFSPHFKKEHSGKKLILAFTQGNPDISIFQSYYEYTKNMFQLLEFDVKNVPVITGTRNIPAREQKNLRVTMEDIGSSLVLD